MIDPYEDDILEKNKAEIIIENKNNLKHFVDNHEHEKKKISENDQFHMLMQLIESGHISEINKLDENERKDGEYLYLIKYKLLKKYVKTLWKTTHSENKYQTIMTKITIVNIWNPSFSQEKLDDSLMEKTRKIIKKKNINNDSIIKPYNHNYNNINTDDDDDELNIDSNSDDTSDDNNSDNTSDDNNDINDNSKLILDLDLDFDFNLDLDLDDNDNNNDNNNLSSILEHT
jgi:hypothetical protein